MKLKYYEWCVLQHPARGKEGKKQTTEVVLPIVQELAEGTDALGMKIARAIPEQYMDEFYRLEVAIRPF